MVLFLRKKMRQALRLCKILKLPDNIRAKVQAFYSLDKEGFSQSKLSLVERFNFIFSSISTRN